MVICFCYHSNGVTNLTDGFNYSDFLVLKIKFLLGCTMVAASTTGLLETSKFKTLILYFFSYLINNYKVYN